MTREEFVRHWRFRLAGAIALGTAKYRSVPNLMVGKLSSAEAQQVEMLAQAGQVLLDLAETTDAMLRAMYDSLHPPKKEDATNGRPATTQPVGR